MKHSLPYPMPQQKNIKHSTQLLLFGTLWISKENLKSCKRSFTLALKKPDSWKGCITPITPATPAHAMHWKGTSTFNLCWNHGVIEINDSTTESVWHKACSLASSKIYLPILPLDISKSHSVVPLCTSVSNAIVTAFRIALCSVVFVCAWRHYCPTWVELEVG